jgi:adenylosuccinate synthase
MSNVAVIGCGFGDEGKGKVVSYLCQQSPRSLVIRYCGGQQAGHHVVLKDGLEHVFSNFGSGTLQDCPTYWSQFCCIDPIGILNELEILVRKGIQPTLYIDEKCPVTTPYDKEYNRTLEDLNKHGSCGVGVGQTFQREEDHYSITVGDLLHPTILAIKMGLIKNYYEHPFLTSKANLAFLDTCAELVESPNIIITDRMPPGFDNWVFEGSQGLLLDQNFGFFPHVTRANTGAKNVLCMDCYTEIFLVTRAYQTRHGNGPMTNEHLTHNIKRNPYENNFSWTYQGEFRRAILDLDLLKYAVNKDPYIRYHRSFVTLVITCLDLIEGSFQFTSKGKAYNFSNQKDFVDAILRTLGIEKVRLSRTPFPEMISDF